MANKFKKDNLKCAIAALPVKDWMELNGYEGYDLASIPINYWNSVRGLADALGELIDEDTAMRELMADDEDDGPKPVY